MDEMLQWYCDTRLSGNSLVEASETMTGFEFVLKSDKDERKPYYVRVSYGEMLAAFFEETKRVMS
jgi:hypothetical protein